MAQVSMSEVPNKLARDKVPYNSGLCVISLHEAEAIFPELIPGPIVPNPVANAALINAMLVNNGSWLAMGEVMISPAINKEKIIGVSMIASLRKVKVSIRE